MFEIVKGSNSITTLVSFNGSNGANPYAGLIEDSNGNLFGTAYGGGAAGNGTVFEIVKGVDVWTGAGSDAFWSDPANWESGAAPSPGDSLIFNGAPQSPVNDFPSGTSFASIQFTVLNTNDSGPGNLRQAILDADAAGTNAPGTVVIKFDIGSGGPQTITPQSALPLITNAVTIDGTTQPGYSGSPLIVINGSQAGNARGLVVTADNTTLEGLVINAFADSGVFLAGNGGVLTDCYIGTSADGTQADGNSTGVTLEGASGSTISDNLISGNGGNGTFGINVDSSTNITIQGNKIGTDVTGNAGFTFVDNTDSNIRASNDSNLNILDNVISGGAYFGINLYPNDDHVTIQGNRIGTNASGTAALGDTYGIYMISDIHDVQIGGTAPGAGNVVSGNYNGVSIASDDCYNITLQGNYIGSDVTGTYAIPNAGSGIVSGGTNVMIGGTVLDANGNNISGNLISGNLQDGISVGNDSTTQPVLIEGNKIGTDITGSRALPDQNGNAVGNGRGVIIGSNDGSITVGGMVLDANGNNISGNLISGNQGAGVSAENAGAGGAGVVVEGNYIGTNSSGKTAVPNGMGVNIFNESNVTVSNNVISGNGTGGGVFLQYASNNILESNLIGTDATGNTALPNQGAGVFGYNMDQNNQIGSPGHGNVISGNLDGGIEFESPDDVNNLVQGNLIGTNAAGTSTTGADGNPLGNTGYGVLLYQASSNTIGGTAAGAGNIISGTLDQPGGYPGTGYGVGIGVPSAVNNVVQGNAIGTDASGTLNLGNAGAGVFVFYGATNEQIGGTAPGEANTIAFNAQDGVFVQYGYAVTVRGNSIHDNAGLGIDLFQGTGANHLQSYPVLTGALGGTTTSVSGSLSSSASSIYTLDFYANTVANPSDYGEGKRYLGSATATTDATGNATFTATGLGATSPGEIISATATDAAGDTSQFAADVTALAPTTTILSALPITYGAAGVITVTVASAFGTPTGNVSLTVDSGTPITQALINGSSTFSVNGLSAGDHNLSVSFAAQGLFAASATTGTIHVDQATPVVQVSDAGGGYN